MKKFIKASTQDTTFIVYNDTEKYCTVCGADIKLEGDFDYCPYCGREVEDIVRQFATDKGRSRNSMEIKTIERIERAKVTLGCDGDIDYILTFELKEDGKALEMQYREEGKELGCVRSTHILPKSSVDKLVDLLLKFYNNMDDI
jgi:predicted RNA-binding Zn-ribbon protein involved in translation (DUF1610 family)